MRCGAFSLACTLVLNVLAAASERQPQKPFAGLEAVLPVPAWHTGSMALAEPPLSAFRRSAASPVPVPLSSARAGPREPQPLGLRSRRFYLGLALSTGAGLLAWWSEERADTAYARYMRSAGLARQRDEFALAERYDRLAGAAFLGMQLGLGYTTYVLFF